MKYPPFWAKIRLHENGRKRFGLWIPLFLIWPIVLIIAIILSPLVLILALILWPSGKGKPLLLCLPCLFNLFCSLRGLLVDVKSDHDQVYVKFS